MVVPYHFLIHHCDVRDLYTWIMHLVEEVSRIPGSSILCLLDYLSSACALGLHSSSSMCILCAPQSSVSGLCARKFRGLHYRILLVPGAATMDYGRVLQDLRFSWYSCPGHLLCPTCKHVSGISMSCFFCRFVMIFQVCLG